MDGEWREGGWLMFGRATGRSPLQGGEKLVGVHPHPNPLPGRERGEDGDARPFDRLRMSGGESERRWGFGVARESGVVIAEEGGPESYDDDDRDVNGNAQDGGPVVLGTLSISKEADGGEGRARDERDDGERPANGRDNGESYSQDGEDNSSNSHLTPPEDDSWALGQV